APPLPRRPPPRAARARAPAAGTGAVVWGPRPPAGGGAAGPAAATGTTVTLIEENGTAHTYPGPSADGGPHLRLRRRGGDFVPLLLRTPAPEPQTPEAKDPLQNGPEQNGPEQNGPEQNGPEQNGPEPKSTEPKRREAQVTTPVDTAPPVPPVPHQDLQDPAAVPLPPSPTSPTGSDLPGPSDEEDEEQAYELSTLSGGGESGPTASGSPEHPAPTPPDPATVTKKGGAGLHKWEEKSGRVVVKRRGPTDKGFVIRVPAGAVVYLDGSQQVQADPSPYIWAEYTTDGKEYSGYIRDANVARDQIGDTGLHFKPNGSDGFTVFDGETRQRVPNSPTLDSTGRDYLKSVMRALDDAEKAGGFHITARRELVKSILADLRQLLRSDVGPWAQVVENVGQRLPERVERDREELENSELITESHVLSEVRFTGSDFQNGGQQVLFLRFTDPAVAGGDPRTVVYKPSSLEVDAELFGKQGASVARTLDPGGERIPTYAIVPVTADDGTKYGYMQFVRSGGPRTADALLRVYESLGANMALSYLVGLEDVHHENVLLLDDRVQVIDMEATSGVFNWETGFESQLWLMALQNKVQRQLVELAHAGELTGVPSASEAREAAGRGFADALARIEQHMPAVNGYHAEQLAGRRARFVPIATSGLRDLIFVVHNRDYTYEEWTARLERERREPSRNSLAQQALGQTGSTLETMHALLRSRATFDALRRGDVPYFTRDLGSHTVYDEAGSPVRNPSDAEARLDYPKIGDPIDVAVRDRAGQEQRNRVLGIFDSTAVEWIANVNTAVSEAVDAHVLTGGTSTAGPGAGAAVR
ncbi:DUF4135 domain-containing protein, partial [Streptomyces sp. NPDC054841]